MLSDTHKEPGRAEPGILEALEWELLAHLTEAGQKSTLKDQFSTKYTL